MVEEVAPFLESHGRQSVDLSPVKIVKVTYVQKIFAKSLFVLEFGRHVLQV